MTVSYHITLWSVRGDVGGASSSARSDVNDENSLTLLSQRMIDLMREYLDRASGEGDTPSEGFRAWSQESFAPRASELRREIQASSSAGEAWNAMVLASDRMVAMAREPEQIHLRQLATDNVFDAAAAVENRIGTAIRE